ncbi:class I SAM-dependent methyltransferase [Nostoc sp.]|uniref:class I SAM-dependent methyltransferase n=1 Tax=Nostoc sp. TaxID=1180 RepID=UPI002FF65448
MTDNVNTEKLNTIYEYIRVAHGGGAYEKLDESLQPRPPEMLYDFVERLNLVSGSTVLDVGCGYGNNTCDLARRFNFQVKGIDIVDDHLEFARNAALKQGLAEQVSFIKGSLESIPFEDATFDLIWCRDVLEQVQNVPQFARECDRVLKPNGSMVIYTIFATELMEPKEAARLYKTLGVVPESMSASFVEECFKDAGLQILTKEVIGSELMQFYEEREGRATRELMRLARMILAKEKFLSQLGQTNYEVTSALYHWAIYQLIGKLSSTIYTLRKTV